MELIVIIPAYKREDCLKRALQSLLNQTSKEFDVLVVDDCSPDPLLPHLQEFSGPLNILYACTPENGGPGVARQLGLDWAHENGYKYAMFMDSDDMLMPHAVARLLHEIRVTKCDLVSSAIWKEGDTPGLPGETISSSNQTWMHGKIFDIKYLYDNELRFPPMRLNEDMCFNLCVMELSDNVGYLNEITYIFKNEANSLTRNDNFRMSMVSTDFIIGMYHTTKYLQAHNKITRQILINITALYKHYQIAKIFDYITDEIDEYVKYMIQIPEFNDVVNSPEWMGQLEHIIPPCFYYDNKVYWFKQSYVNWFEEMLAK